MISAKTLSPKAGDLIFVQTDSSKVEEVKKNLKEKLPAEIIPLVYDTPVEIQCLRKESLSKSDILIVTAPKASQTELNHLRNEFFNNLSIKPQVLVAGTSIDLKTLTKQEIQSLRDACNDFLASK